MVEPAVLSMLSSLGLQGKESSRVAGAPMISQDSLENVLHHHDLNTKV